MLGDEVALYFGVIVTFGRVRNFETTCFWERKFDGIWQHSRADLRYLECEHIKSLKIWGWYTFVSSPKFFIGCFGTGNDVFKPPGNPFQHHIYIIYMNPVLLKRDFMVYFWYYFIYKIYTGVYSAQIAPKPSGIERLTFCGSILMCGKFSESIWPKS